MLHRAPAVSSLGSNSLIGDEAGSISSPSLKIVEFQLLERPIKSAGVYAEK